MSFDYNPYKHIEIISSTNPTGGIIGWCWYCHSCGAVGHRNLGIVIVDKLYEQYKDHLKKTHKNDTEDYFKDWPNT